MDLCLDTNAYSALMRDQGQAREIIEKADAVIIPTVVMGELYAGFAMGRRNMENVKKLQAFLSTPGTSLASITQETAERYGKIVRHLKLQGSPIPTNDIWIAAVSFETGTVLLTADSHFSLIPLLETMDYA